MPGGPGSARGLRLMAVHAHPDDESSKGAATMARYVADGARVRVVSCTGGERGDILNPRLQQDVHILRDLAQVRRDEMAAAQQILGIEHTWLGFVDSGLPEGDPLPPLPAGCFALDPVDVTTEALVRVVREFRPHVMTTYDERGATRTLTTSTVTWSRWPPSSPPATLRPTPTPASRGSRSRSTTTTPSRGRGSRPSTTRCWRPASTRRTRSGSRTGSARSGW